MLFSILSNTPSYLGHSVSIVRTLLPAFFDYLKHIIRAALRFLHTLSTWNLQTVNIFMNFLHHLSPWPLLKSYSVSVHCWMDRNVQSIFLKSNVSYPSLFYLPQYSFYFLFISHISNLGTSSCSGMATIWIVNSVEAQQSSCLGSS